MSIRLHSSLSESYHSSHGSLEDYLVLPKYLAVSKTFDSFLLSDLLVGRSEFSAYSEGPFLTVVVVLLQLMTKRKLSSCEYILLIPIFLARSIQ